MLLTQSPASLAFPYGATPGFDPTHPLVDNGVCRISAVASGANFFNVLNGSPGIAAAAPTSTIDGTMGAVATYTAANARSTFPSINSLDNPITVAAIFSQTTIATAAAILGNSPTATGYYLGLNASSQIMLSLRGSSGATFTATITAGVPYFVVISALQGTATAFLVLLNLLTGTIQTGAQNYGAQITPTGNLYSVGNWPTGGLVLNGKVAAVMQSTAYLGLKQLLAVASDPWSFWYPQYDFLSSNTDLGAPGIPWWNDRTSASPGVGFWNKSKRNIISDTPGNLPPFPPSPPPPPPPGGAKFTVSGPAVMDLFPQPGLTNIDSPTQRRTI